MEDTPPDSICQDKSATLHQEIQLHRQIHLYMHSSDPQELQMAEGYCKTDDMNAGDLLRADSTLLFLSLL